jgi:TatD DNase family protein
MLYNFHTHTIKNEGREILNFDSNKDLSSQFFSYGIHPKDTENKAFIENCLKRENCLAVGEIGLDKLISVPLEKQIEVFKKQINFSEKYKLPLILHCVKAWNEILAIKKELKPKQKWIFHGFSKTNIVEDVLKNGMYIGIGTRVLFDEKLQACLHKIPLNKILLETDDDEKNSILSVYEKVSEIKKLSLQELEIQIEENFRGIFENEELYTEKYRVKN